MTTNGIGAAWGHGELPPWMQPPPGFDEAAAADAADDAARAALRAELLTEWYGPLDELETERPAPTAAVIARRRRVLDDALRGPDRPTLRRHNPSADAIAQHRQVADDALQPTRPSLGRSTLYAPMRPTADDTAAAEYRRHAA